MADIILACVSAWHSFEVDFVGQIAFKVIQILRVDVASFCNKSLHFDADIPLNLQLLNILEIMHRIFLEEVPNQNVFDIALLLREARDLALSIGRA